MRPIDMTDPYNQNMIARHPTHVVVYYPTLNVSAWVDAANLTYLP